MKRVVLPLILLAASPLVHAQSAVSGTGLRARIAYGFSPDFRGHSQQGAEVAVALPLGTVFGQGLWLEPSYYGNFDGGSDGDANVFRATVYAHHAFKQFGVRVGVGYSASSRAKGGDFDGQSGGVIDLGVDVPFKFQYLRGIQTYADIHNVFADKGILAGFFVGVGVKF